MRTEQADTLPQAVTPGELDQAERALSDHGICIMGQCGYIDGL